LSEKYQQSAYFFNKKEFRFSFHAYRKKEKKGTNLKTKLLSGWPEFATKNSLAAKGVLVEVRVM
jgi:hypothetical protein